MEPISIANTVTNFPLIMAIAALVSQRYADTDVDMYKDLNVHYLDDSRIVCDIHMWIDYDLTSIVYLRFAEFEDGLILVDITDNDKEIYFRS